VNNSTTQTGEKKRVAKEKRGEKNGDIKGYTNAPDGSTRAEGGEELKKKKKGGAEESGGEKQGGDKKGEKKKEREKKANDHCRALKRTTSCTKGSKEKKGKEIPQRRGGRKKGTGKKEKKKLRGPKNHVTTNATFRKKMEKGNWEIRNIEKEKNERERAPKRDGYREASEF